MTSQSPAATPKFALSAEGFALQRFAAIAAKDPPDHAPLEMAGLPRALQRLASGFVLNADETALLGLLFAASWSERVARKVIEAAPASGGRGIPLWLALRLIPELDAAAVGSTRALRSYGLIEREGAILPIESRLMLSDAVAERLAGLNTAPADLFARIRRLNHEPALIDKGLARELIATLSERGRDSLSPVVMTGKLEPAIVSASLASIGLHLYCIRSGAVPEDAERRDRLARDWSREAAFDSAALLILAERDAPVPATVGDFAERVLGHVLVTGLSAPQLVDRSIRLLAEPNAASSTERWRRALGKARSRKLGPALARIASQFRLEAPEIDAVCAATARDIDLAPDRAAAERSLWHRAGRVTQGVPTPGVTIVEPEFEWEDLILPPAIAAALHRLESHVRHATTVLDEWGFAERLGGRGRGIAALFSGPSGTGKTMAAEVIAKSLDLRMMLIDLSQIISKYIGETSKQIAAAFEQAERSGAVMVWNEGDAIWGARGAVGNATDRHVNAEVGDLLQRIEAFRGFTIVTTNMKQAIDPAFLRRFRFCVDFPMPSQCERLKLWKQAFPTRAPIEPMDFAALAALPLSGGSIRNIALGSAFQAAELGEPIGRQVITAEVAEELRKHNLPMPQIEWDSGL